MALIKKPPNLGLMRQLGGRSIVIEKSIKAKDSPWDAVLMGSVVSTVDTNVRYFFNCTVILFCITIFFNILFYCFYLKITLSSFKYSRKPLVTSLRVFVFYDLLVDN